MAYVDLTGKFPYKSLVTSAKLEQLALNDAYFKDTTTVDPGHKHNLTTGAIDVEVEAERLNQLKNMGDTVTGENLTKLTDGSPATFLHKHSIIDGTEATLVAEDVLTYSPIPGFPDSELVILSPAKGTRPKGLFMDLSVQPDLWNPENEMVWIGVSMHFWGPHGNWPGRRYAIRLDQAMILDSRSRGPLTDTIKADVCKYGMYVPLVGWKYPVITPPGAEDTFDVERYPICCDKAWGQGGWPDQTEVSYFQRQWFPFQGTTIYWTVLLSGFGDGEVNVNWVKIKLKWYKMA